MSAGFDQSQLTAWAQRSGGAWDVHAFDSIGTTNAPVRQAIAAGVPEGYTAAALEQVAGYGRQGRAWVGPRGGLYFSVLLRPQVPAAQLPSCALAVSFAIRRALVRFAANPQQVLIKWPNDVLCSAGKLCGIICEYVEGAFCAGIGINVFRPEEIPAVGGKNHPAYLADLLDEGPQQALDGTPIRPNAVVRGNELTSDQARFIECVLAAALEELGYAYDLWQAEGFAAVRPGYLANAALMGTSVKALTATGAVLAEGAVVDVDPQGCLVLRTAAGTLVPVASGEIHLQ